MILAIETATLDASVCAFDEAANAPRAVRRARVTTHSEMLLAMIEGALAEAGTRAAELSAIACGAGPGSFTGLRIGLATAKGLCLALERPLLLVPSLQALAARMRPGSPACASLDAWKGEVYAALYREDTAGEPEMIGEERVLPPEELVRWIHQIFPDRQVQLLGDAAARWPALQRPELEAHDGGPPDAVEVARLAARRLARGERDDLALAAPRYVRPSEAELAMAKKRGT